MCLYSFGPMRILDNEMNFKQKFRILNHITKAELFLSIDLAVLTSNSSAGIDINNQSQTFQYRKTLVHLS